MTLHKVTAIQWTCDTCHDTGLSKSNAHARADLAEHNADYHDGPDPDE